MGISKGSADNVLSTLDSLSQKGGNPADDCSDKLISHIFVYILALFALIAGIHEYSGISIDCLPLSKDGSVTQGMAKHLNSFCLTQTLYYYDDFWKHTRLPALQHREGTDPSSSSSSSFPSFPLHESTATASTSEEMPTSPGEPAQDQTIFPHSHQLPLNDQKAAAVSRSVNDISQFQSAEPRTSEEQTSRTKRAVFSTTQSSSSDDQLVSSEGSSKAEREDLDLGEHRFDTAIPTVSDSQKIFLHNHVPVSTTPIMPETQLKGSDKSSVPSVRPASTGPVYTLDHGQTASDNQDIPLKKTFVSGGSKAGYVFPIGLATKASLSVDRKSVSTTATATDTTAFVTDHQRRVTEKDGLTETHSYPSAHDDPMNSVPIVSEESFTGRLGLLGTKLLTTIDHAAATEPTAVMSGQTTTAEVAGNMKQLSQGTSPSGLTSSASSAPATVVHEGSHLVVTSGEDTVYAMEIPHMITVIFVLQAIILKLPQILWKELLKKTGSNVQTLIQRLTDEQSEDADKQKSIIARFVSTLPIGTTETVEGTGGRTGRTRVTVFQGHIFKLYMLIKALYLAVLALQFWLLSEFFSFNFVEFGPSLIRKNILKQSVSYITDFPPVVLCHFRSPTMNMPVEGVWIQCVLVFNNFLQNMLLIEWVGLVVLGSTTIVSIIVWVYWHYSDHSNISFIVDLLPGNIYFSRPQSGNEIKAKNEHVSSGDINGNRKNLNLEAVGWEKEPRDVDKLKRFVLDFLGADAVFLLRIVKVNANRAVLTELIGELYKVFLRLNAEAEK